MYVPHVLDKSSGSERVFDLWSRLNRDRIIFLGRAIDDSVANLIVAQLLYLESQSRTEDIYMYINSPGGSVSAGMAIYDVMNYIDPDVNTLCYGEAASMGALLLSSGAKGKRYCLPNSSVMIHQVSGGTRGQVTDMEINFKRAKSLKDKLNKIIASNTGQSYEKICSDAERDYWMTAEEALEYGMVDSVLTNRGAEKEDD
jgi:ATP-dependent Clp protease protease subunit